MKKSIFLSLALVIVLVSSVSFAPAPRIDTAKPVDFHAQVSLQQESQPDWIQHGKNAAFDGPAYVVKEEKFIGSISNSDWSYVNGAGVDMSGITHLTGTLLPDEDVAIYAAFQMTLTISVKNSDGEIEGTLIYSGNGEMKGTLKTFGTLNMNMNSVNGTGTLASIRSTAKIEDAKFYFMGDQAGYGSGPLVGKYQQ